MSTVTMMRLTTTRGEEANAMITIITTIMMTKAGGGCGRGGIVIVDVAGDVGWIMALGGSATERVNR